jgi:hypothetical protein
MTISSMPVEPIHDMESFDIGGTNFGYSATRVEDLADVAAEFTLVTIAVDFSGSVIGFEQDLRNMIFAAVEGCKKDSMSANMLVRVILFSTQFRGGVYEIHGFKPVDEINPQADYPTFYPKGQTPLCDAAFSGIGPMVEYGRALIANDFQVNAVLYLITDGVENASTLATTAMIMEQNMKVSREEELESLVSILIGINATAYQRELDKFHREAGFTSYMDVGEVTPSKLAKLGGWMSQSTSSQSLARGSGGPSQNISASI